VEREMTDYRPLDRQVPLVWLAVAGLSTVTQAAGGDLTLIHARRLTAFWAAPVAASARLGEADFSAQAGRYGLQEVDVVADR
jgi:ABC-type phosphate transport system auxiliary subunit